MLISIEGNIGSGKSTVIEYLKSLSNSNIEFVDEPVNEWLNVKDKDGFNALDCFYKNKEKNAFCFQVLAYITRLKKLIEKLQKYKDNKDVLIITERSIDTDKNVFAKMLYEDGYLTSIEWETYNYWFSSFEEISQVDIILYIKTNPDKCLERINKRHRVEESNIDINYLNKCHSYHENWINDDNMVNKSKIIKIDGHKSVEEIRTQVIDIIDNLQNKLSS
jgi:deoxyadenosine/deoxycytidine kinase